MDEVKVEELSCGLDLSKTAIVVAYDEEMGIGKDGALPWHIPEELQHFKNVTNNSIVIMGRITYESLPTKYRPLPDRLNMVITSYPSECYRKVENSNNPLETSSNNLLNAIKTSKKLLDAISNKDHFDAKFRMYQAYTYKMFQNRDILYNSIKNLNWAYIIGGATVYDQAVKLGVPKIIASEIKGKYNCDRFFPNIKDDPSWSRSLYHQHEKFDVVIYERAIKLPHEHEKEQEVC